MEDEKIAKEAKKREMEEKALADKKGPKKASPVVEDRY